MNLSFSDLGNAIKRLPVKERAKLLEQLQQDTWKTEFQKLRAQIRTKAKKHPISQKKITKIVENVRQKLYDQSRH